MNGHAPMVRALDHHAHVAKGLQGRQGVLTLKEAFHLGHTLGQRAQHDRAMRDRLVTRHADAPAQAATRAGDEGQIIGVHCGFHIGPACEDLAEMFTRHPCPGEHAQQLMAVSRIHRVAQGVEVTAEGVQGAQHRFAIGEEDVVPHHRIAAGNPREIAEAAGGVAENLEVLVALGQRIHQAKCQQMRQVAGRCQHFVVTLDLHMLYIRAQLAPETIHHCQRRGIGLRKRRQDDLMPTEQLRIGCLHPALLGASNGMARYKARRHATKRQSCRAHHVAFGAAHIGKDRLPEVHACQYRQQFLHGQDRHGKLDHIRALARNGQVRLTAVHHPQLHRQRARLRVEVHAHHFATQPAFTQALGEGATDQPQADHHQATDHRHSRLQCSDINHGPEPWPAPQGSGCSQPANRW